MQCILSLVQGIKGLDLRIIIQASLTYILVETNTEMYLNIISILIHFFKTLSDSNTRLSASGISLSCTKGKILELV